MLIITMEWNVFDLNTERTTEIHNINGGLKRGMDIK